MLQIKPGLPTRKMKKVQTLSNLCLYDVGSPKKQMEEEGQMKARNRQARNINEAQRLGENLDYATKMHLRSQCLGMFGKGQEQQALPLEALTLNSAGNCRAIPSKYTWTLQGDLFRRNKQVPVKNQASQLDTSKLNLFLLEQKVLRMKAVFLSRLQLFRSAKPFCMALVFLLARKQPQWREQRLRWSLRRLVECLESR